MKDIVGKVYRRLIGGRLEEKKYQKWIRGHMGILTETEESWERLEKKPLYSIVVPLYRTPEVFLRELVKSVQEQTYPRWELILSDGSGEGSPLTACLRELQKDRRVRVLENNEQLDISENTNRGLKEARGDYIVFADHDDVLPPYALYECTKAVCENDEPDIIYSDEDKVTMDGKTYFQPHFKPDYNLTLLQSMNYFCHLVAVKRKLREKVGFLRAEYNGAQDYDFVLRCVEQTEKICHIPKILYHWRSHEGSIAGSGSSKEYAFEAGRKAVEAHYERCKITADVRKGDIFGICHTKYKIEGKPLISIVVSGSPRETAVLDRGGYVGYEVIARQELEKAKGDYYLFLDSRIEKASGGWLREMLRQAMQPGVGIVGAHIYQKNGRQKSAGVVVGEPDLIYEVAAGEIKDSVGYFGRNTCAQEYSAVDGMCMLVSGKAFEAVGGLDPVLGGSLQYADLCLKMGDKGFRVVYTPDARLLCGESASETLDRKEQEYFRSKWKEYLRKGDPYYNENQILKKPLFRLW